MCICGSEQNVLDYYDGFKTMPDEKDNNLFYGVELECLTNFWGISKYKEHYKTIMAAERAVDGHAILKPDANFEIVTIPATLRYHKEVLWNKFIADVEGKVRGENGVGMHIHFSRDALTPLQLAKVVCFVHERENSDFLTKIAGRNVDSTAIWCATRNINKTTPATVFSSVNSNKGAAIHISSRNGGKTAELRIFQSNPTKQGIFQGLEFIDAVIKYCHRHGTLEKEIVYTSFLDWFVGEGLNNDYPFLNSNLVRLGYVTRKQDTLIKLSA